MAERLQTLIEAAQNLSPLEQLELIHVLSGFLQRVYPRIPTAPDFWNPTQLEQLSQGAQARPVLDIDDLAVDFWPEQESTDEVLEFIYGQRREDRLRE